MTQNVDAVAHRLAERVQMRHLFFALAFLLGVFLHNEFIMVGWALGLFGEWTEQWAQRQLNDGAHE